MHLSQGRGCHRAGITCLGGSVCGTRACRLREHWGLSSVCARQKHAPVLRILLISTSNSHQLHLCLHFLICPANCIPLQRLGCTATQLFPTGNPPVRFLDNQCSGSLLRPWGLGADVWCDQQELLCLAALWIACSLDHQVGGCGRYLGVAMQRTPIGEWRDVILLIYCSSEQTVGIYQKLKACDMIQ